MIDSFLRRGALESALTWSVLALGTSAFGGLLFGSLSSTAAAQAATASATRAELRLPALFANDMVLPRERTVPVWGHAAPGASVTVSTSANDAASTVIASSDGAWRAEVMTGPAGGPHTLTIQSGQDRRELSGVLFGEVWLCSGQSNMEWPYNAIRKEYAGSAAFDERVARGNAPLVRLFHVPRTLSATPADDVRAVWRACSPESIRSFSAIGYFFAQELAATLDVPVGIVGSAWGGTPIESWTSGPVIERFEAFRAQVAALRAGAEPEREQRAREAGLRWWQEVDRKHAASAKYGSVDFDDSQWTEVEVPGTFEQGPLGNFDGVVWFRRDVDVPAAWAGQDLQLDLGAIDDDERTMWNGVTVGASGGYNVARTYTVPGAEVRAGRNVLAVCVHDSGGAGGFTAKANVLRVAPAVGSAVPLGLAGKWRAQALEGGLTALPGAYPRAATPDQSTPSILYNGMIAPLQPFPFAGVLWYQGESNINGAVLYRDTFQALILDWRAGFNAPALPFLWAQIAPFDYKGGPRKAHATALLREAQDGALRLPHTGQVILTDLGDLADIHPDNKWTVAQRFVQLALERVYGREVPADSPRYASHSIEGGVVRVSFEHAEGGLTARDDAPNWFHVAGADRRFVPAVARIEGATVLMSSPEVPSPRAVRFGWSDVAVPNLFGASDLPLAPFRTDDWDIVVIEAPVNGGR